MAGLVPAIHALAWSEDEDVDPRHTAGQDEDKERLSKST